MKSILITGASGGLGLALAELALRKGHTVFGTYRKTPPSERLIRQFPETFFPIHMDLAHEKSIARGVKAVEAILGDHPLHGLINNAAYVEAKPVLFCDSEDLLRHFVTNVAGPLSLIKYCLATLHRSNSRGAIINVNSVAGHLPLPFQGAYGISKSALTMLTNCIRLELPPVSDVQITDIWLGRMQTEVHRRNIENAMDLSNSGYAEWAEQMKKKVLENRESAMLPMQVAHKILSVLDKRKMKYRYLIVQGGWKVRLLLFLGNIPFVYRAIRTFYFGKPTN